MLRILYSGTYCTKDTITAPQFRFDSYSVPFHCSLHSSVIPPSPTLYWYKVVFVSRNDIFCFFGGVFRLCILAHRSCYLTVTLLTFSFICFTQHCRSFNSTLIHKISRKQLWSSSHLSDKSHSNIIEMHF